MSTESTPVNSNSSKGNIVEIALAILYPVEVMKQRDKPFFLMQLRDDIENIVYPGHWGLFGGHLDPGETAEVCIHRELVEEIGTDVANLKAFKTVRRPSSKKGSTETVVVSLYHGVLDVPVSELILGEGMDLKLVSAEELQRCEAWSEAIAETRPMGDFHCRTLLEFWNTVKSDRL